MKLELTAECRGTAEKISKKDGHVYHIGLFEEGIETIQLMLPVGNLPLKGVIYHINLDYNVNYKNLNIVSFSTIQSKN